MNALATFLDATPRYLALLRSQYWSAQQWSAYREQHLERTLDAAAKIPFYAERFGGRARIENLARLSILRREDVPALYRSVTAKLSSLQGILHAASSGTTGVRAEFLFDWRHQRLRYAARARYLRAHRFNPLRRTAWIIGGRVLAPGAEVEEESRFLSPVLVGVRFLSNSIPFPQLADAVARIDPVFIYLYPTMLDGLLREFEKQPGRLPSLRLVLTGGEILDDELRAQTRRILGVEIADNYGSTEAFLAWQCPMGSYHQNAEHVLIEIVDDAGNEVAAGKMGRVLVTTLGNYLMPLVRYEIGDYAVAASGPCACGRRLPLLGSVLGRGMNLFRYPDGRLVATWDLVNTLRLFPEMKLFHIVQKSFDHVLVKYVGDAPVSADREENIRGEFARYLGPGFSYKFERVPAIPRTAGGKFMLTLSEVADRRAAVHQVSI